MVWFFLGAETAPLACTGRFGPTAAGWVIVRGAPARERDNEGLMFDVPCPKMVELWLPEYLN